MGTVTENIVLTIQAVNKGFTTTVEKTTVGVGRLRNALDQMGKIANMNTMQFSNLAPNLANLSSKAAQATGRFRLFTAGMKGFRMEMLGVMFFGMAMTRMMMGLLNPSAEAMGIFEIWSSILEVTFLPVLQEIMPLFLDFADTMFGLDESTQKIIGTFVILSLVLGTALFLLGTLALGLGSLFQIAPLKMLAIFGKMFVVLGGLILIVIGIEKVFKKQFEGIGLIIAGVGVILLAFGAIWGLIPIAVGLAVFAIIKNWDKITIFFKDWVKVFKRFFGIAVDFFKDQFNKLPEFIKDIFRAIVGFYTNMWDKQKKILIDTKNFFKDTFGNIFTIVKDIMDKVSDILFNPIETIKGIGKGAKGIFSGAKSLLGFDDFIFRPGQAPIAVNPQDTIVGFKGNQGLGGGVTINQTNSISGSNNVEIERAINENNRRLTEEVRRLVKT